MQLRRDKPCGELDDTGNGDAPSALVTDSTARRGYRPQRGADGRQKCGSLPVFRRSSHLQMWSWRMYKRSPAKGKVAGGTPHSVQCKSARNISTCFCARWDYRFI